MLFQDGTDQPWLIYQLLRKVISWCWLVRSQKGEGVAGLHVQWWHFNSYNYWLMKFIFHLWQTENLTFECSCILTKCYPPYWHYYCNKCVYFLGELHRYGCPSILWKSCSVARVKLTEGQPWHNNFNEVINVMWLNTHMPCASFEYLNGVKRINYAEILTWNVTVMVKHDECKLLQILQIRNCCLPTEDQLKQMISIVGSVMNVAFSERAWFPFFPILSIVMSSQWGFYFSVTSWWDNLNYADSAY